MENMSVSIALFLRFILIFTYRLLVAPLHETFGKPLMSKILHPFSWQFHRTVVEQISLIW